MNITYTRNGDYLIPNIIIRNTKPIGHYGRLRKAYLEMHRPILFNELVLSDKLFEHCAEDVYKRQAEGVRIFRSRSFRAIWDGPNPSITYSPIS